MFSDTAVIKIKAGTAATAPLPSTGKNTWPPAAPTAGTAAAVEASCLSPTTGSAPLSDFRYKRKYVAENGQKGGPNRCAGKSAPDLVVKVPWGTLLYDQQTGRLMADMSGDEPFVAAQGGRGGWGTPILPPPPGKLPVLPSPGCPARRWIFGWS